MPYFFALHTVSRRLLSHSILLLCGLALMACQTAPSKQTTLKKDTLLHNDSTVYFNHRKASVSMRASFSNTTNSENVSTTQTLANGYKLQFRSIKTENVFIEKVYIIAGGQRIVLNDNGFFVAPNKGVTLSLNYADSEFIQQQNNVVLRFMIDEQSHIMSIKQHKLSEFIVP